MLRVALYSLLFNLALVAAKLTLSALSGSLALRADAIHSTVDVMASLALILGVKISERKSESFPLGLYKVENLASIAISFLLFLTAYEIVLEAVRGEALPINYQGWVLYAVAAIIPLPYLFGSFQIKVGERTGSPSLIADGVQHKADVLTTSLVFLALIAQSVSLPLDRIAAAIIALAIIKEPMTMMWEAQLGRISRNIMCVSERPLSLAASTNSRVRRVITSPRTRRASGGHETTAMAMMIEVIDG